MSTPALFEIQTDAVKLARKITAHVGDVPPQDVDPAALVEFANQLVEVAQRFAYFQRQTPEYKAKVGILALGNHREKEPR